MVGLGVLFAEYAVAAAGLLVYLGSYLIAARGEWYRSVFGLSQVLLCVMALSWYAKVFFGPVHNMSTSSAVFYGLFALLFWTMAGSGLWIASGAARRRRERVLSGRHARKAATR